jgi:hypothetical protein
MGALAACGGDQDSAAGERVKVSSADEPPEVFVQRMAKLLQTSRTREDCAQLDEINARSLTRFRCPASKAFRRSMARLQVVGSKEYGPGAIVDYTSGDVKDGAAIVLFVASRRKWAVSRFGVITEPSADTGDDESRAGFRTAVDDYLTAVRTRDCKAFAAVAFTGDTKGRAVCETVFPATRELARRLRQDRTARPKYEGGNATYGFFTIETSDPIPVSAIVSVARDTKASPQYVVLDSAPTLTEGQRKAAAERARRSQRRGGPETSPSRKVDGP